MNLDPLEIIKKMKKDQNIQFSQRCNDFPMPNTPKNLAFIDAAFKAWDGNPHGDKYDLGDKTGDTLYSDDFIIFDYCLKLLGAWQGITLNGCKHVCAIYHLHLETIKDLREQLREKEDLNQALCEQIAEQQTDIGRSIIELAKCETELMNLKEIKEGKE